MLSVCIFNYLRLLNTSPHADYGNYKVHKKLVTIKKTELKPHKPGVYLLIVYIL
jgi:hypothetical protein